MAVCQTTMSVREGLRAVVENGCLHGGADGRVSDNDVCAQAWALVFQTVMSARKDRRS